MQQPALFLTFQFGTRRWRSSVRGRWRGVRVDGGSGFGFGLGWDGLRDSVGRNVNGRKMREVSVVDVGMDLEVGLNVWMSLRIGLSLPRRLKSS